jgi:ribose transport system ATP-binding protein/D-xylose transport system ATP-binding protein
MTTPAPYDTPCLDVRALSKSFGGVQALKHASFSVAAGQVHGLLGANGAGKSTLMKILTGLYPHGSYDGEMVLRGKPVRFRSPSDALSAGVGYVPQELNVIDQLTVAENVFVGRLPSPGGRMVHLPDVRRRATALLDRRGIPLQADTVVAKLPASARQLVMIARALAVDPDVLILDEPTSSLTSEETDRLIGIIRALSADGVTVILISHRIPEILSVCDAVTVLRDGSTVATFERAEFDEAQMVQAIVGRRVEALFPDRGRAAPGAEAIRMSHLSVAHPHARRKRVVDDVSLSVRHGEIVGIAGLIGAGRTELLSALYGRVPYTGSIEVEGRPVRIRRPRDAQQAGIGLLTEDRKSEGMLFNLDIARNISIANLAGISAHGILDKAAERSLTSDYFKQLNIKAPSAKVMPDKLSGGNQQKVVLARVLMAGPRIILLDEPTKGVDISTKQEIYRLIRALAEDGAAVIVVSSEFPELIGVSDRIVVLCDGRIAAEVPAGQATEEGLVAAASGAS